LVQDIRKLYPDDHSAFKRLLRRHKDYGVNRVAQVGMVFKASQYMDMHACSS
jgi:hypothetical protein